MTRLVHAETHASVGGVRDTLEAYRDEDRRRFRIWRNGRETQTSVTSKWQRVERAFLIFRLGAL